MSQLKNAQLHQTAELSAPNKCAHATTASAMTPRQTRVLDALASTTGWIAREAIDRIAGSSNGPDVISRLRHKLGADAIEMKRVQVIDRDGNPATPGRYRLTDMGRQRLAERG